MQIRLEELKQGTLSLEFEEPPETFAVLTEMIDSGECEFLSPITTVLRAQQIGAMIEIAGHIATRARLTCGRCLQGFETPLKSSFTLTYTPAESDPEQSTAGQQERELTAEDMGLIYYQGEEINFKNEIQEQVVLAFPLRALCRPDCRGLCPKCGADLNTEDCDCDPLPPTGKFAALKNLKI